MMNKVFVLLPTIIVSKGYVWLAWLGKLWCLRRKSKHKGCFLFVNIEDLSPDTFCDGITDEYLGKIAKENEF